MPLWITHRGLTENAPENSAAAFEAAAAAGFVALETDLRLTRDGHIVLAHDPDLARLANDPRLLRDLDASEVSRIRVAGHPLLFFEEFAARWGHLRWTLDIKASETIAALARIAPPDLIERTTFLCWRAEDEALVARTFPGARFYAQEPECKRAGVGAILGVGGGIRAGRTYALTARFLGLPLFRERIVEHYHRQGARVVAFLPETAAEAQEAVAAGVDEVLTNGRIAPETPGKLGPRTRS